MEGFPLHCAAKEGDLEMVKQLIEGGASTNSRDDFGHTPLHWAAERGRLEVVDLLSSIPECDINFKDRTGHTPVLIAAYFKKESVVKLLLERGARVDCGVKNTPDILYEAIYLGWADVVRRILDREELDIHYVTVTGYTFLMCAALYGQKEVASLLIQAGVDANRSNNEKATALHIASFNGYAGMVQVLLETGRLHLNAQDKNGCTALHLASSNRCREVVEQLLVAGADPNVRNYDGKTALSVGLKEQGINAEGIRIFCKHGGFIEECDYQLISQDPVLKESVLKDVDLCTQSVINKYHFKSLPALKGISCLVGKLPNVDKFKLPDKHVKDVVSSVRQDIQRNSFCNVVRLRPIILRMMCVESLLSQARNDPSSELSATKPPLINKRKNILMTKLRSMFHNA